MSGRTSLFFLEKESLVGLGFEVFPNKFIQAICTDKTVLAEKIDLVCTF